MAGLTPNNFIIKIKEMDIRDRKKIRLEELLELIMNAPDMSITNNKKLNDMDVAISTISKLLENVRTDTTKNSAAILKLSEGEETTSNRLSTVEKEFVAFKKTENVNLKQFTDELDKLKAQTNEIEQYSRVNNLEIVGLKPPLDGETDADMIVTALNTLEGLRKQLTIEDVDIAHPIPSRRKDNKRVSIIRFTKRTSKNDVLEAKKNTRDFHFRDDENVFINEHLSPHNRTLFARANDLKRELNFKYLWTKNGVPQLRKQDNSEIYAINNYADLENLTNS